MLHITYFCKREFYEPRNEIKQGASCISSSTNCTQGRNIIFYIMHTFSNLVSGTSPVRRGSKRKIVRRNYYRDNFKICCIIRYVICMYSLKFLQLKFHRQKLEKIGSKSTVVLDCLKTFSQDYKAALFR